MGQFKNFKDLRLPSGGLNEALEVLLLGQSLGETVRQVAETVSPRSTGRPPPLLFVRAPERVLAPYMFQDVEGSNLFHCSSECFADFPECAWLYQASHSGVGLQHSLVPLPFRMSIYDGTVKNVQYLYPAWPWWEVPVLCGTKVHRAFCIAFGQPNADLWMTCFP